MTTIINGINGNADEILTNGDGLFFRNKRHLDKGLESIERPHLTWGDLRKLNDVLVSNGAQNPGWLRKH